MQAYEAALAIRQKLADAHPSDTRFQSDLARSHNNIGTMLRATGKPDAALQAFEAALAIQQELADANPTDTQFQSNLAGSHYSIGFLLRASGKPAEAMKAFESAFVIQQKLADANPTVIEFQSNVAQSHINIVIVLRATGKPGEALQAFESALPISEQLAREHPESPEYAGNLGVLLSTMAVIDLDARRFDAARDRYLQAVVWQKKSLAASPRNPTFRQALTVELTNMIKANRGLGDSEGVAEAELELAKLRDSDPADATN